MRWLFVLLAMSLALLFAGNGVAAQSAPAYPQSDSQASASAAGAAPVEADPPVPVTAGDAERDALQRTIARQGVLIDNQKALIAALKSKLAAAKRKCR
ncbi:hypothetical protein PX554_06730 [Sphingomonas sp. H39-1-10]|uniref:hypothetical protein n=1 Tax=Sphingomonas TaxID=13687 RepID=UPI00088C29B1|nr:MULTISPECIES: hypothetical protein [Sphingomonas]MDF0487819.1 hypothetical protein [Sphingomonas pollutisoli]SDA25639.1 hypothetical protein SAMN03159340_01906 [Sphingomonas sp. NFR15]